MLTNSHLRNLLCYRTVERYCQKLLEEETKALDKLDHLITLYEALRMLMKSTLLDDEREGEGQRVKELVEDVTESVDFL